MDQLTVVFATLLSYLEPVRVAFAEAGLVMGSQPSNAGIATEGVGRPAGYPCDAYVHWQLDRRPSTTLSVIASGTRREHPELFKSAGVGLRRDLYPFADASLYVIRSFGEGSWKIVGADLTNTLVADPRRRGKQRLRQPMFDLWESLPSAKHANGNVIIVADPSADLKAIATFFLSLKEDRRIAEASATG